MSVTLYKGPWQLIENIVMAIYTRTIRGKKTKSDKEIEIIVNGDDANLPCCGHYRQELLFIVFGKTKDPVLATLAVVPII
jgi:hypothetical protein